MWQKMKQNMSSFLQGRYGTDILNKYLIGLSFILVMLGMLMPYISILGFIVLIYAYFRMFSKNVQKRGLENYKFVIILNKIKQPFKTMKLLLIGDKTSKYYKCKNASCKQIIRVPKGRGKIQISCPKCKEQFIKKT